MALLMVAGWRISLMIVGFLGIPVVISILLQSGILSDQVRHGPRYAGPRRYRPRTAQAAPCCCSSPASC